MTSVRWPSLSKPGTHLIFLLLKPLGASAIGSLPLGYVQNAPGVPAYRAAIEAKRLPLVRGIEVIDGDRMRRAVIQYLMCDKEVDLDAVRQDSRRFLRSHT